MAGIVEGCCCSSACIGLSQTGAWIRPWEWRRRAGMIGKQTGDPVQHRRLEDLQVLH